MDRERALAAEGERAGRVVVVGSGSIGVRHLTNLRQLGVRDLVLYRGTARPLRTSLPVAVVRDLDAALAGGRQAVFVCNPTALHLPVALAAVRAGVREAGPVVAVGYQFRLHPGLRQVRAWIEEGVVGQIVSAEARWGEYLPAWHPQEDYRVGYSARRDLGGGALLTLSHTFDYLAWMLGDVVSVAADTARRSGFDIDVEDTAGVLLRFASGALGLVSLDYVERPGAHTLRVVGCGGVIRWSAHDGVARLLEGDGLTERSCVPPPTFGRNTMFLEEVRRFLEAVEGRAAPACGLDDGIRALRIAVAAKRSAEEGRRVDV